MNPIISRQQQPEVIVNPVTGDRMTILESGEAYAKIRFDLPPHAKGSPLHYHTQMSETFTVIAGCLRMEIGQKGNWRTLYAGESLHVPAGVHHSFHNPCDHWVAFTSENQPATGFEQFIRGMYGLAIDGKVNHEGMPTNLLQLALLLKKADLVIVGIPLFVQTLLIGMLEKLAQGMKVERSLAKYWKRGAK
ncbi:cupin domain-containing protein [Nostoc sp. CENA543]|uniref:cupin domain-containing protein n=1 Tax=Nostoc sp. CENA543 TaxID=1869241 RepID=UPI001CEF6D1F|nr:cupin domain-containing protein [Nostoc sp. CENA543]